MDIKLKERISVCYTCCGPTFRESVLDKLKNFYFDNENIFYCILTDDKSYFDGVQRQNLVVNELKDFYQEFPKLEKNEYFLESTSKNDYSTQFCDLDYIFPFSTYRFNLLQSIRLGIKNVAILCTDSSLNFKNFNDGVFDNINFIYNAVSHWDADTSEHDMTYIVKRLNDKFNLYPDKIVRVLDAAARLFIPENLEALMVFFTVWNDVIEYLYDENLIRLYRGSYVINDEYILAPIYNSLNLSKNRDTNHGMKYGFFDVVHNVGKERYWRTNGADGLEQHKIYEEFLKINKIKLN